VGGQPALEAQLANLADEITYNAHDVDDGVRSGLITVAQLMEIPLFARYADEAVREHPQLRESNWQRRWLYEAIRRMLSEQVYDVIRNTGAALQAAQPASADAVRALPPLVGFSDAMRAESAALKRFLFQNLYRHPQVVDTTSRAKVVVRELFDIYLARPQEMKPRYATRAQGLEQAACARVVADFIAGMTDRYALREHERLTGQQLLAE
jgi:dGTPase